MGYGTTRFAGPVDPNLICGICSSVLEDAVLTTCGHSFCSSCLETWLARPSTATCPECRSVVNPNEAKPILSLRNLINGFQVECDNTERGCKVLVKLERLRSHLDVCPYHPVVCAGCGDTVNRFELAGHQIQCHAIAASVEEDEDEQQYEEQEERSSWFRRRRTLRKSDSMADVDMAELVYRINCLEMHVNTFRRELHVTDARNQFLDREYKKAKKDLAEKQQQIQELQFSEFDPKYDYGHTPQSIARLSLLVARFLLQKPGYVDSDRIFLAIKKCYEQYFRSGTEFEHDVHMLLATSYASNWFSPSQRLSINCWLHCIARYREETRRVESLHRIGS